MLVNLFKPDSWRLNEERAQEFIDSLTQKIEYTKVFKGDVDLLQVCKYLDKWLMPIGFRLTLFKGYNCIPWDQERPDWIYALKIIPVAHKPKFLRFDIMTTKQNRLDDALTQKDLYAFQRRDIHTNVKAFILDIIRRTAFAIRGGMAFIESEDGKVFLPKAISPTQLKIKLALLGIR